MKCSLLWTVLAAVASAAAGPAARHSLKVKEAIAIPRGWTKRDVAPRDMRINLRIALPQSNFALLEQELYEVRCAPVLLSIFLKS